MLFSGSYSYLRNGVATGIRESWSIDQPTSDKLIIRAERDAAVFGSRIKVEAFGPNLSDITQFRIDWANNTPGAVKTAQAIYTIDQSMIQVWRMIDGVESNDLITRPPNLVISPLMRVFYGAMLAKLSAARDVCPVLVPWIHQPNHAQLLLSAQLDPRQAKLVAQTEIDVAGHRHRVKRYEYVGGNYTADSQFWVNEAGLLVRYTFCQTPDLTWDVLLASQDIID